MQKWDCPMPVSGWSVAVIAGGFPRAASHPACWVLAPRPDPSRCAFTAAGAPIPAPSPGN